MAPLEIRHRSVRPISAKHAQASRFLQQSRVDRARPRLALLLQLPQLGLPQRRQPDGRARRGELLRSRQEEMRPRADRHRCVGRLDIPQPPEAARSQPAGIPWRLRNVVCRGFLGKYGYVTLFRGASRCELESAGRCLFGNLPYPFDPPGDDRQDFRQRGQSAFPPARCTLLGTTPPVFHFRQSGLRSARRCDGRKDGLCEPRYRQRAGCRGNGGDDRVRSEEQQQALQSLMRISYAVFCLKKKKSSNANVDTNKDTKIYNRLSTLSQ